MCFKSYGRLTFRRFVVTLHVSSPWASLFFLVIHMHIDSDRRTPVYTVIDCILDHRPPVIVARDRHDFGTAPKWWVCYL